MNIDRVESQIAIVAGVLVILLAETLLLQQQYLPGVLVYSVMLIVLIIFASYEWDHPQHHLMVLGIPAIIRVLNFSLPLGSLSPLFAQLVTAIPMLLAGLVFVWMLNQGPFKWQFHWRQIPIYLLLIAIGSLMGFLLFQVKQPLRWTWDSALLLGFYVFVIVFAMAVLEEWLFRGIMQSALSSFLGKGLGGLVVALVYTILHVNQGAGLFVLMIFVFSLGLSWLRSRSENLLYVSLVHIAANIVFFLILPIYR